MAKRAILISNKETERTFAIRMISINKYIYIYIYLHDLHIPARKTRRKILNFEKTAVRERGD